MLQRCRPAGLSDKRAIVPPQLNFYVMRLLELIPLYCFQLRVSGKVANQAKEVPVCSYTSTAMDDRLASEGVFSR